MGTSVESLGTIVPFCISHESRTDCACRMRFAIAASSSMLEVMRISSADAWITPGFVLSPVASRVQEAALANAFCVSIDEIDPLTDALNAYFHCGRDEKSGDRLMPRSQEQSTHPHSAMAKVQNRSKVFTVLPFVLKYKKTSSTIV